jgi:putative membrane protein
MHLPDYFLGDLTATLAFGLLAIILVVAGYKLFDGLLTKLDFNEELEKGNMAVGVMIATFIAGLCYVIANVVSAVLGG